MKKIFLLISLLIFNFKVGFSQIKKWPTEPYSYVKVYMYNLEGKLYGQHAIIKNGKLDSTVVAESKLISLEDIETIKRVAKNKALNYGLSKCYIPHHGFVFYNKENIPIASLTVCFYCEQIVTYPQAIELDWENAKELKKSEIKKALKELDELKKIITKANLPIEVSLEDYKKHIPNQK